MIRLALPLLGLLLLTACNTIHGAGQDIQDAGQTISTEAAAAEQKM